MAADDRFICSTTLGRWQTNCYVIGDRATARAVIVDPGEHGATAVPPLLDRLAVTPEAILLTHGHLDHLWAVPALARQFDVPVLLHADDRWLWDNPAAAFGAPFDVLAAEFGLSWTPDDDVLETVVDGQTVTLASTDFRVAHTPGHTPGHVTYRITGAARMQLAFDVSAAHGDDPAAFDGVGHDGVLLSGDLLFAGAIGRTDLVRGSTVEMLRSLAREVLTLDDDTLVLPGHGPTTTVATERATNPYLAEARTRTS
ncbi:MAG: MBL fold metallo-hydrolase [Nitriliruptoraceae bacterium]